MPYALSIHVHTSFNIINSVYDYILTCPEIIVENVSAVIIHQTFDSLSLKLRVHLSDFVHGSLALGFSDIIHAEQELSTQVRNFNIIVVCDC